jgi:hypothetical protein
MAVVVVLAAGAAGAAGSSSGQAAFTCRASLVHYGPYGGSGTGLDGLPWVGGSYGLRGLLWYWPQAWRHQGVRRARIFTGGRASSRTTTKILWAFVAEAAKTMGGDVLVVHGRRLDARGSFTQRFTSIAYEGQNGAPSYASVIDVPKPGCWRLRLTTGQLRSTVVFRAIKR